MGVERDYTDEVYARLIAQIEEIKKANWNPVSDFIGDIFIGLGQILHIFKSDGGLTSVKKFQALMIDKADMTEDQLKKIFEEVKKVDKKDSKDIETINQRSQVHRDKMRAMSEMIHPNLKMESVSFIKQECEGYNKQLKDCDKTLKKLYDNNLNEKLKDIKVKAGKNCLSSVLNAFVDIVSLPVKWTTALVTKGPIGLGEAFASDTWGLINDVFAVGGSLGGLGGAVIVQAFYASGWPSAYAVESTVSDMNLEKYATADGLTDVLEANGSPEWMIKGSKNTDDLKTLIDIGDYVDNLKNKDKYEDMMKTFEKLKENSAIWQGFKKSKKYASSLKKIYKVASTGIYDLYEGKGGSETVSDVVANGIDQYVGKIGKKGSLINEFGTTIDTVFDGIDNIDDLIHMHVFEPIDVH